MCGRRLQVTLRLTLLTFPHRNPGVGWAARIDRKGTPQRRAAPGGPQHREGPGAAGLKLGEAGLAGRAGHPASGARPTDAPSRASAASAGFFDNYAR